MSGAAEMLVIHIDDISDMVRGDEIRWSFVARSIEHRRDDVDVLAQSAAHDRLERVEALAADAAIYADLVKQALQQLHETKIAADRAQSRIRHLLDELRLSREQVRALGAQLRISQEAAT